MTHVHFIGIGGSGLSAIARLMLESGYSVSGSDRALSPFALDLQTAGVTIWVGHTSGHVTGADWVVRSSAIPDDNPEVVEAWRMGIPVYKRADFLGRLMEEKIGIAIAGTHGKTTTTAMMAWTLSAMGQYPSFIVGGVVNQLGVNARAGKGETFVIEADEYDRMFLGLKPKFEIVTYVEHDHPDCYPTAEDFRSAFENFTKLLPEDGALVACGNEPGANSLADEAIKNGKHVVKYGTASHPGYGSEWVLANNVKPNNVGGFSFDAAVSGKTIPVALAIPGMHNVRNALAVLAVIDLLGLPLDEAAAALGKFTGAGRRFDVRGEAGGVTVVDDYGHHPTEIRTTLAGARARYPQGRIWAVWQPHTYSRTQLLFNEFASAFDDADEVIVSEIYKSREATQDYSSKAVVDAMKYSNKHFIAEISEISKYLLNNLKSGDVVIVFSAGDADQISAEVFRTLQLRAAFGEKLQENVPLAPYTSARTGGNADFVLEARSADELASFASKLWELGIPFTVLGGGSNVLVSDNGVRGVVIINKAKAVTFQRGEQARVACESGAVLSNVSHRAAANGLGGMEWAATVPGTIGGAVYGNAGAFGGDIAHDLIRAEILTKEGRAWWTAEQMQYGYRTSVMKKLNIHAIILSAEFRLVESSKEEAQAKIEQFTAKRKSTQPPGASMGSMFKNPPGDYAGRLIEAAGLKGTRIGNAEISTVHGNFFINTGETKAADIKALIEMAQKTVKEKFSVDLELEVELLGEW